jgi:hypothetical protein
LRDYFNISFLEIEIKKNKSMIYKALLKYGYSNFSLEILEYCGGDKCISREQYYLNLLKPKYNILSMAASRTGQRHSQETLDKMSKSQKAIDRLGVNNPMFGKIHPKEGREKFGAHKAQKIEVLDILTNEKTVYNSMSDAAKALNSTRAAISAFFVKNQQTPHKKRYILKKI